MKTFNLTPDMLTLSGTFYPKGYAFIMFADTATAEAAGQKISKQHSTPDEVLLLSPAVILRDIGKVDGDSDIDLPSIGTEGATVRKYVDLARQGQAGIMVKVDSDEETEQVMQVARQASFSYGQRYHLLAMEDLE